MRRLLISGRKKTLDHFSTSPPNILHRTHRRILTGIEEKERL